MVAAEGDRVLVRAGPICAGYFDGFVIGLQIEVDGSVRLHSYAVMDCGAWSSGGLDDVVVMAEDVGEPEWRRDWERVISGLLENPASELL